MSELDLAVIVVNWNVRDLLVECLQSVQDAMAAAGLAGEIWVVDNASQDGSLKAVQARFGSAHGERANVRLRLVASPINLMFAGGQNLGLMVITPNPDRHRLSRH